MENILLCRSNLVIFLLFMVHVTALDVRRLQQFHQKQVKRSGDWAFMPSTGYNYQAPNFNPFMGSPAYSLGYRDDNRGGHKEKECRAFEPFRCPKGLACISIQYLCDGAPDCPDGYDEDAKLCTASKRPPVEETAAFLHSLLTSHGPNYLEKLFGQKARNALQQLGGTNEVAIALSESQTIDEFGSTLRLDNTDVSHLRSVFMAVENGDTGLLKSLGIKDSELGDVMFFLEKLLNTGFLD